MRTGGLKQIHIVIIGVVVGILAAVGVFFALIKPLNERYAETESELQGYNDKIATKPQAEKKLAAAQQKEAVARVNLQRWETKYMRLGPERAFLSMKDPQAAMILLWKEHANIVGPLLTKFIRQNRVRLVSQLQIPGAPVDPNMINKDEYTIPLGQVQVVGTFANINRFLRSVQNAPRLIRVNNVELQGQSPNITANMDMTMVVLPRDSADFKPVTLATGDASGGGGTGYGGYPGASAYTPTGGGNSPAGGGNSP